MMLYGFSSHGVICEKNMRCINLGRSRYDITDSLVWKCITLHSRKVCKKTDRILRGLICTWGYYIVDSTSLMMGKRLINVVLLIALAIFSLLIIDYRLYSKSQKDATKGTKTADCRTQGCWWSSTWLVNDHNYIVLAIIVQSEKKYENDSGRMEMFMDTHARGQDLW